MTTRPTLEFFYAGACPWSYLAFARLEEVAMRTASTIAFRPVLEPARAAWQPAFLGAGSGPAAGALAAYVVKDLADWARFCGLTIYLPASGPATGEWVQRVAVLAIQAGCIVPYVRAAFRAHFGENRNLGSCEVVRDIGLSCGLAVHDMEAAYESDAVGATLARHTAEFASRGGFASPTVFFGRDMYVGHDRMPLLESALMRASDRVFIAPGDHGRR